MSNPHPGPGRPWPKGVSGNPTGKRRHPISFDLIKRCRELTPDLVEQLVALTTHKDPKVQLQAITYLVDRGWGRARQAVEVSGPEGERLFPRPEELRALTDAQLERLLVVHREIEAELAGNGGPPA
jgi:hypothetical protein